MHRDIRARRKGEAVPWVWLQELEHEAEDNSRHVVLVRDYNNGGPAVFISPALRSALNRLGKRR